MRPFKTPSTAARSENWTSTRIRPQDMARTPNWRETSEFQITTTDESDLDSSNEENNPPVSTPPQQIEELKLQTQMALKQIIDLRVVIPSWYYGSNCFVN